MFTKKGWFIVFFLLLLSVIVETVLMINNILTINFWYNLVQNLLISIIVTPVLVKNIKLSIYKCPKLDWVINSIFVNLLPNIFTMIIPILYYPLGQGKRLISSNAKTIPYSGQTIFIIVVGFLVIWLLQILISAIGGLISLYIFGNPKTVKH